MIIDRTHRQWAIITTLLSLIAVVAYLIVYREGRTSYLHESVGGTPLALSYGIISLLIFVFAALLGWRRKTWALRVGRLQFWLKGHVWFTLLTIPLVIMHSGNEWGAPLTQVLMWIYWIVMISGLVGIGLQHVLPRMMFQRLKEEVIFEQIPFLKEQLLKRSEEIHKILSTPIPDPDFEKPVLATGEGEEEPEEVVPPMLPVPQSAVTMVEKELQPYFQSEDGRKQHLGDSQAAYDFFQAMRLQSADLWHPQIEELEAMVRQRQQLDQQARLQHWLHYWLLLHGPLSILLLGLTVWHAIFSLISY